MARNCALRAATPESQHLIGPRPNGIEANIVQEGRATSPSVASGVLCYYRFARY